MQERLDYTQLVIGVGAEAEYWTWGLDGGFQYENITRGMVCKRK